ncbi:hypothetical protein [Bacillus toyonensis]|uniref:hypothetical protein n=1 Tax=Bacillus toyonensis TaxID=155322 RepID=UPI0021D03B5D|nr:hypothetical protein [Bacillus toyonensis]MCU5179249.1 hypothetical protein [Bacillus toyonensis]
MAQKYAIVQIDQIDLKSQREHGVIKLYGDFDYDFGIQINTFGGRHFSFHDKISLEKPTTTGHGVLTITYGNREAYLDFNPAVEFTTVVSNLNELSLVTDGIVFHEDKNCRLNKLEV